MGLLRRLVRLCRLGFSRKQIAQAPARLLRFGDWLGDRLGDWFGDRLGGVLYNKEGADLLLKHGADPKLGRPCQAQNKCR